MSRALPAELALLAACCRWPPSRQREAAVRAAASRVDWDRLPDALHRHRVVPLVHDGIARAGVELPPRTRAWLDDAAARAKRKSLAMAAETAKLQAAFDEAGLPALFIKGESLGLLAYGALARKQSCDIDVLTAADQAIAAREVLENRGYRLSNPRGLDEGQFAQYVRHAKEACFSGGGRGIAIDLHWRLADNPMQLREVTVESPQQAVEMGGIAIRTLGPEFLYAYLCVHGARHAWARLKWLSDVNAILAQRDAEEVLHLHREASGLGAGRASGLALLLCHRVFGFDLPPGQLDQLRSERMLRVLLGNSLFCLAHRTSGSEAPLYSAPGLRTSLANFVLEPGLAYPVEELRTTWISARDRANHPLPGRLEFAYHLLRLPLWVQRVTRRLLAGSRTRRRAK